MQVALDGLYRGADLSMFQFAICKPWLINLIYPDYFVSGLNRYRGTFPCKDFDISGTMIKLEDLQKMFNHPSPIECLNFPFNKKLCDQCEPMLAECLLECNEDSSCISTCNRDYLNCTENC